MASQPSRIVWTRESFQLFQGLSLQDRKQIEAKLGILAVYPQMYQVEVEGFWQGMRRFQAKAWKVYYVYWQPTDTIYVEAIRHVRQGDPE